MAINNSMNDVTAHSPASPYAISKLDCEHLARMFYTDHGCRTTCLRYFNVYGPRQDPNSAYAAAIPIFFSRARAGTIPKSSDYNKYIRRRFTQMNADTVIITLLIYFSRSTPLAPTPTHPDPGRHAHDRTQQAAA